MIEVESQDSSKYDSDTTSVLLDDNNDSKYDTAEYHVESAAEDEVISAEENSDSNDDVEEECKFDADLGTTGELRTLPNKNTYQYGRRLLPNE